MWLIKQSYYIEIMILYVKIDVSKPVTHTAWIKCLVSTVVT